MPVLTADSTEFSIYRSSSPIFDAPEFAPLRRVKPLPKRRRSSPRAHPISIGNLLPPILPPGPDATADELVAHAEALTAQLALQSYYMPALSGLPDFMRGEGAPAGEIDGRYGAAADEDERDGDGDYFDHLQQPGNAKKRKVPAHLSGAQPGPESADGQSGGEEEQADGGARADMQPADVPQASPMAGEAPPRRGRMLPATLVGLQHKEMLRQRKRQLAAVLGALSHGDTLALDQALSAKYPLLNSSHRPSKDLRLKPPLHRRRATRYARFRRAPLPARRPDAQIFPFPEGEFSFVCHSATSDRLVATREEVAVLHARFEAELARQAAKAAEAAKQAAEAASAVPAKRGDRAVQKARKGPVGGQSVDPLVAQAAGTTKPRGKKKKRSALANASNPHHLRNYVPSRLPNQGQLNAAQTIASAQNLLSPHPLQFLSAEIPPRRGKKARALPAASQLVNPAEEWICPNCEYKLFYGDDEAYRLAIRNRKKILKRRRRARERAAAAASGTAPAIPPLDKGSAAHEEGEGEVPSGEAGKQGRVRGEREKDGDRGDGVGVS
ncbi:hypothetical protein BV25DRAFT_324795 [Artomyces pyxidatus]|uniref:Uncharacterized protein n=1 Tax=Artomyces pyxidatus TaxID=48021 RepID=A0ACB8T6V6_9AGAM|nr:hypothetical protein BV25DRAFT_324795 [Artomyces pyxidatus]